MLYPSCVTMMTNPFLIDLCQIEILTLLQIMGKTLGVLVLTSLLCRHFAARRLVLVSSCLIPSLSESPIAVHARIPGHNQGLC